MQPESDEGIKLPTITNLMRNADCKALDVIPGLRYLLVKAQSNSTGKIRYMVFPGYSYRNQEIVV